MRPAIDSSVYTFIYNLRGLYTLTVATTVVGINGLYVGPVDKVQHGDAVVEKHQQHGHHEICLQFAHQFPDSTQQLFILSQVVAQHLEQ